MSRIAYCFLFFTLCCSDYHDNEGFDSLGEKKVCDSIKVRVRACTGTGVETWGGCREVPTDIAWARDCEEVKWKLRLENLKE
jgi:hypothetical protein